MRGFRASRAAQNFKSSHFGKPEQQHNNEGTAYNNQNNGPQQNRVIPSWAKVPSSTLQEQKGGQFKINGQTHGRYINGRTNSVTTNNQRQITPAKPNHKTAADSRPIAKVIPLTPKPKPAPAKTASAGKSLQAKGKVSGRPAAKKAAGAKSKTAPVKKKRSAA